MYIVRFQDPAREPDRIFAENVDKLFDFMLRGRPLPPRWRADQSRLSLARRRLRSRRATARAAPRQPEAERAVFVETFRRTGFTGGINWYRNFTRNWERAATLAHDRVPCLMISAELDPCCRRRCRNGMEARIPDLTRHLVMGSGHWTQQERPEEVSRVILDWRNRRFP